MISPQEKIESVFTDAKEKHAIHYTPYRGLTAVRNWVKLKFAAMNLKKYAIHKDFDRKLRQYYDNYSSAFFVFGNFLLRSNSTISS